MNKESLFLGQIILGLRDEYSNVLKQLDELKSMMIVDSNCDVNLGLYSKDEKTKMLIINLEERLNGINKLINNIYKRFIKSEPTLIERPFGFFKGGILINDPTKYRVEDIEDFYHMCDKTLQSLFNLYLVDKYTKSDEQNLKYKIGHNGVFLVTNNNNKFAPSTGIDYHACSDQLVINNYYNNSAFVASVHELMNTPIIVSEPIAEIVNNNPKSDLPIVFDGLTNTKFEQRFELIEEPGRVLAKRVK